MLFRELDEDGSGALDEQEFKRALKDPRFKIWMAALDLQSSDAENLFKLLALRCIFFFPSLVKHAEGMGNTRADQDVCFFG